MKGQKITVGQINKDRPSYSREWDKEL